MILIDLTIISILVCAVVLAVQVLNNDRLSFISEYERQVNEYGCYQGEF